MSLFDALFPDSTAASLSETEVIDVLKGHLMAGGLENYAQSVKELWTEWHKRNSFEEIQVLGKTTFRSKKIKEVDSELKKRSINLEICIEAAVQQALGAFLEQGLLSLKEKAPALEKPDPKLISSFEVDEIIPFLVRLLEIHGKELVTSQEKTLEAQLALLLTNKPLAITWLNSVFKDSNYAQNLIKLGRQKLDEKNRTLESPLGDEQIDILTRMTQARDKALGYTDRLFYRSFLELANSGSQALDTDSKIISLIEITASLSTSLFALQYLSGPLAIGLVLGYVTQGSGAMLKKTRLPGLHTLGAMIAETGRQLSLVSTSLTFLALSSGFWTLKNPLGLFKLPFTYFLGAKYRVTDRLADYLSPAENNELDLMTRPFIRYNSRVTRDQILSSVRQGGAKKLHGYWILSVIHEIWFDKTMSKTEQLTKIEEALKQLKEQCPDDYQEGSKAEKARAKSLKAVYYLKAIEQVSRQADPDALSSDDPAKAREMEHAMITAILEIDSLIEEYEQYVKSQLGNRWYERTGSSKHLPKFLEFQAKIEGMMQDTSKSIFDRYSAIWNEFEGKLCKQFPTPRFGEPTESVKYRAKIGDALLTLSTKLKHQPQNSAFKEPKSEGTPWLIRPK